MTATDAEPAVLGSFAAEDNARRAQALREYADRLDPPGQQVTIKSPSRGRAVLACNCGAVLDLASMHRVGPSHYGNGDPHPGRIVCGDCARNRPW